MLAPVASAFVIAVLVALLARRARALSVDGAITAALVGTLALLAGWKWGVLLILYFASSSALTRFGAAEKTMRTKSVIEKGGERDAMQVIANGGIFAIAAMLSIVDATHALRWAALGIGALAASASDTWATEVGTLVGGTPRSILGFARTPLGMSGGVTVAGTAAACGGAAFVGLLALAFGFSSRVALAVFLGGIAGSTLDSILGATLQLRRHCDQCNCATERKIHDCGTPTRRAAGLAWLDNDAVNLICGAAGGLLALAMTG